MIARKLSRNGRTMKYLIVIMMVFSINYGKLYWMWGDQGGKKKIHTQKKVNKFVVKYEEKKESDWDLCWYHYLYSFLFLSLTVFFYLQVSGTRMINLWQFFFVLLEVNYFLVHATQKKSKKKLVVFNL